MTNVVIRPLIRYRVDRTTQPQPTASGGLEHLVVVIFKAKDAPEIAYSISKADAMMIGHLMMDAARDAKVDTDRG